MQRRTLLSLAVSVALGGALPAVYAQSEDAQPETRTQGTEQHDRFYWDRNEFRDRDFAMHQPGTRHASDRRDEHRDLHRELREERRDLREAQRDHREFHRGEGHDGHGHHGHAPKDGFRHVDFRHDGRGHRDFRHDGDWRDRQHVDWREIRGDIREIRADRARLEAELADRQHNRDQLKVARAIGDQPGVEWERNEIRANNRDIREIRAELRGDRRELRQDLRDLHRRDHGARHADFRHDGHHGHQGHHANQGHHGHQGHHGLQGRGHGPNDARHGGKHLEHKHDVRHEHRNHQHVKHDHGRKQAELKAATTVQAKADTQVKK